MAQIQSALADGAAVHSIPVQSSAFAFEKYRVGE
jgi:hypothetical protein